MIEKHNLKVKSTSEIIGDRALNDISGAINFLVDEYSKVGLSLVGIINISVFDEDGNCVAAGFKTNIDNVELYDTMQEGVRDFIKEIEEDTYGDGIQEK